jgi:hypothetical protein
MADLSPAAERVLNAVTLKRYDVPYQACPKSIDQIRSDVAAALRALADQVVPWQQEPTEDSVGPTIDFGYAWALFSKANDVRQEIIAIADELKGGE